MFDVCMFVFVSYMGFIVIFIVLTVERVEVFWYDVTSVTCLFILHDWLICLLEIL